ncbi:TetR family transcriptional regulator C-terminal domain-containing protein [Riemerella columbina]|uniref:TetR family transcriptional regulator C-terminal domain-containing protein n=1 Tax=Riemerella columbina TaxID=103810 RepID=UPI00035D201E|nr:TetR family transcriptional regulator C-terminal domain-containing protein [Riemerella columbina]
MNDEKLMKLYIDEVLTKGERPKSVYQFAKQHQMDEAEFYGFYSSFDAIERSFFTVLMVKTLEVLHKTKEYKDYEAKDKLLSFYYTFFENLKANRSFVLFLLKESTLPLQNLSKLSDLRTHFLEYIEAIGIDTVNIQQKEVQKIQQKAQKEGAWLQFLSILKFWLNDDSKDFEKTDVFIEKSIDIGFEFFDANRLNKLLDFGKFLFKEGKRSFFE